MASTVQTVFNLLFAWLPNWVRISLICFLCILAFLIIWKLVAFVLDALPFV